MTPSEAIEWRYLRVACVVVGVIVAVQVGGWLVYRSVHHGPTPLVLTEKCLRREKLLTIESIAGDEIAPTARGGAIATRVEGNGVHVAIATSDREASELADAYRRTAGRQIDLRLDVRGRVIYVWEQPHAPTASQRQTMYDCWYE